MNTKKICVDSNSIIVSQDYSDNYHSWQRMWCSVVDWGHAIGFVNNCGYKTIKAIVQPSKRPSKVVSPDVILETANGRILAAKRKSKEFIFYELLNGKYYKLCSAAA